MSLAKTICCKPFEFSSFSLKNLKVINSTSNRQLKSFLKLELKHERWKNSKELQTLLFRDSKQFGLICLFVFCLDETFCDVCVNVWKRTSRNCDVINDVVLANNALSRKYLMVNVHSYLLLRLSNIVNKLKSFARDDDVNFKNMY